MKLILIITLCYSASLYSAGILHAQIPRTISYQGVLASPDGTLIKDGNHTLVLTLYPTLTGSASLFTESQNVTVVRGIFNVIIGSVTALPQSLTFDRAYFLGVSIDGGQEIIPRTPLTAVPYALYAARAAIADGLSPNATGVVTSINEQAGSLRLVGAGGTTVTNAGSVFTISSSTGGSVTGFKLPYSDSAFNSGKSIFEVANTGSVGNTISSIGAHGSLLTGMTTSAIFGDGGIGYNGVTGFSNGGSNAFAGVVGRGTGTADGIIAVASAGDAFSATSVTGRAGFFQTTNAASTANTLEAISNGNTDAIRGTSPNIGVHGVSPSTGVLGETQSSTGTGIEARYSGIGVGTALQLDNGALKVSGVMRSAFVHTATPLNIWGPSNAATEINNPLCNGDSTAMVFITHSTPPSPTLPAYVSWWHIVYYDTTRQKWQIYAPGTPGIGVGDQFYVLVIKR